MKDKKVSVIVPVYNQEKYLKISIPSILNQEYSNLEIILVNDGSTDNSAAIIQQYSLLDNRIVLVQKDNGGLVDATLSGIEVASGEYIIFLDPDDHIGNDFISNFMNAMDKDYDFIAAGFYLENGKAIEEVLLEKDQTFCEEKMIWLRSHYLINKHSSLPSKITFHSRWNKIYKATTVKKTAIEFANYKDITLGEDNVFTYIFFSHSKQGRAISRPNSYFYNIGNQNSMMNNSSITEYCSKVSRVYTKYRNLMLKNEDTPEQADMLYYSLMTALLNKVIHQKYIFYKVYKCLYKDKQYRKILWRYILKEKNLRQKAGLFIRYFVPYPVVYLRLSGKNKS
mgnify:CR=1 FL=1